VFLPHSSRFIIYSISDATQSKLRETSLNKQHIYKTCNEICQHSTQAVSRRPLNMECGFNSRPVHVKIVADEMELEKVCALVLYHAASSGNPLPTFLVNVSVSFSRVKESKKNFLTLSLLKPSGNFTYHQV
jgi:hypothetical protein